MRALPPSLVCAVLAGCATAPAVGRGGTVYDVIVDSVNGRATAARRPASYPACIIQVGNEVRRVWLAGVGRDGPSPAIMKADATALKAGVLVETAWHHAVVHKVSDQELQVGAAVVYVPNQPEPIVVELRFRPATAVPPD